MLTPLQQTPIPLDPVRQQITPTPPIEPPPPPQPAEMPVQANESPQDKFNPNSGDNRRGRQDQALEDQQKAETAGKLRTAYLRLNELQREAGAAVAAGNASWAKELAAEAADVAQTIPANVGMIEGLVDDVSLSQDQTSAGDPPVDLPGALGIARAGLSSAKDVVDSAASIPYHPVADRIAIDGMRHQVLDAMAGVEAIAARNADAQEDTPAATPRVDVKA